MSYIKTLKSKVEYADKLNMKTLNVISALTVAIILTSCGWVKTEIAGTSQIPTALLASYCSTRLTNTPYAGGSGTALDPYVICTTT